ncbi:MAG: type II toxin-antitoxin system prevent-host-death family antitoxin [Deferrisomatales bacterium]|nr:type II toxin-antitoxin system prevent-host-death family antitoxin [Deferrisomatales bacterium]
MGITWVTATEAVRSFSELLNRIRYQGDRYTITRAGKPVATIGPAAGAPSIRTLGELPALVHGLPGLDPEDTSFANDVAAAAQPPLPEELTWG